MSYFSPICQLQLSISQNLFPVLLECITYMVFYDYLPKFSVTVIIFKDIVESVILLNDDA